MFTHFLNICDITLVDDDKIIFIKNKVKYIRKDERITVDK